MLDGSRGRDAEAFWKFAIRPRLYALGAPQTALRNSQPHGVQHATIPPPTDLVRAQAFIAIHAALVSDLLVREQRDVPHDRASANWTRHV